MIVNNANLQKNVFFSHKFQQKVGLTLFDFQIYDVITTTKKVRHRLQTQYRVFWKS